jgi:hypothetical protein
MRGAGATLIAAGSLLGLVDAARQLYAPVAVTATIDLLNTVPITFTSDSLSAFFLVAIFAVSGLTAVYSFHYMDKSDHAGRTAAHFLFFSLLIAAMALVVTADNMVAFILCWEIMSLSSFFLVVYSYEKEQNRRACKLVNGWGGQPGINRSTGMSFSNPSGRFRTAPERAAADGATADRDHHLGSRHGLVSLQQGGFHVARNGARDHDGVGMPWRSHEVDAETGQIEERGGQHIQIHLARIASGRRHLS